MRPWAWLASLVLAGVAQAEPGAQALFARCPGGVPSADVQGRAIDAGFWQRGPVLAVFWSKDCAFCHRHNDRLNRLLDEQPGAAVLGVAIDRDAEAVRRTAARRAYRFPVIVDGPGGCALQPQLTPRKLVPMTCWLGEAPTQPRCVPGEMGEDDLRELLRSQARSNRHS
ncbi:MAG: TlpA family protein disulfide reductase [Roseateles sp.]|uniref:TlpA family protein disulfide reductase n=1 Tax=Roseateles sp. TaxID=1971397 RepID=UPI004035C6CF